MSRSEGIGFSKVLGPWSLGVLAVTVAFAVSGLVGGGAVMLTAGADAPAILAIGALLLLPVLLGHVSRASETSGGGTSYSIVRHDGGSIRLFATGWLSLGAYLCLAALMIDAVAVRVGVLIELHLGRDVPDLAFVAPIAALAVLSQVISPVEQLRGRLLIAGGALVAALGLVVSIVFWPPPVVEVAPLEVYEARHLLSGAALLGASLWFTDVALDYRRMYRGTDRSIALVLSACWCIAIGFTIIIAGLALERPDLSTRIRGVTGGGWTHDNVRLIGFAITLVLCWIVVSKAFSRLSRLAGAMARDGSIPTLFEGVETEDRTPVAFNIFFGTLAATLALVVPAHVLVGLSAVGSLWCAVIVFGSGLRKGRPASPAGFRLPLYPLFPVVSLVICGFFSLIVPWRTPLFMLAWLVVGLAARMAYRKGGKELGSAPEIEDADDENVPVPSAESVYRVLVCVGSASNAPALIRLGRDLARARGGDVVILRVVALLERLPRSDVSAIARRQWRALRTTVRDVLGEDEHAYPIVRIATSEAGGFVDAATSHEADLVLLDTPNPRSRAAADHEAMIDSVFAATTRAVALVHGEVPATVRRVLTAVSTGPDTPAVLSVGETLGLARDGELCALSVTNQLRAQDDVVAGIERVISETGVSAKIVTTEDDDPAKGIVRVAGASDVVVMGTTRDRALAHAGTSGLWKDVTDKNPGAAILVRRAEKRRIGWIREAWEVAFSTLPTLTVGERAEVYAQMRHSARAGVDFYVLIVISASLAIFGLFQDSAAVVIGAMLVAPLMSPIVSISQGIVQGNVRMIRKGLASTMKGTVVAVVVAALFTLAMPDGPPTAQILARTQPTLLDLGVGLAAGAAAAYGISRKSVAAALPGVAIAVALVPPLCVVGYGLGADRLDIAFGATLLYLTNLAAIVFVAAVLFLLLGFYPRQAERRRAVRGAVLATLAGVLMLSVPLALSTWETTRVGRLELLMEETFRSKAEALDLVVDRVAIERDSGQYVVSALVYALPEFDAKQLKTLLEEIEIETGSDARLSVRLLQRVDVGAD